MKTTNASTSLRKLASWGGLITMLLGLLLLRFPAIHARLDALSFDSFFLAERTTPVSDVLVVALDEESHHRLKQSPDRLWDRSLHTKLVETLINRGARAVVFDIVFAEEWSDPKVDLSFAEVLQQASGKIILAASMRAFEIPGHIGGSQVLHPIEKLANAAPWGVVEIPRDADGALRRHATFPQQTSLAWKTAEVLGVAPAEPDRLRWLNYYGPRSFRQVSYWQALQWETLPADIFSNKVVFVGRSRVITPRGPALEDEYPIPRTRWTGQLMSGVEIQATAFLNLFRRDWLEEMPPSLQMGLVATCGVLFGFGLSLFRPLRAVFLAMGGALLVGALAVVLFWKLRIWFPWALIIGAQIPFALGFSVLGFVLRSSQPRDIPDHTLLRCIGRGGFGEVWIARNAIGGFHAVKIVYRKQFARDKTRTRELPARKAIGKSEAFEREFRGVQTFAPISRSHPGLVHILHVGRNDFRGCFYYVMEPADDQVSGANIEPDRYIPKTLAHEIGRRGRLPVRECALLGQHLASALEHLHHRQLLHRDIKPANIIFVSGHPKLADVGLVKSLSEEGSDMTRVGSAGFMAPEGPTSPQADIFALGKTLYEAATGCEPTQFPELPANLNASAEADALVQLHEILLTACETEPSDRYKSAAAMQEELLRLQQNLEQVYE